MCIVQLCNLMLPLYNIRRRRFQAEGVRYGVSRGGRCLIADEMGLDRIVSNQPQYSLLWRVIESEVVPVCAENGISQIV